MTLFLVFFSCPRHEQVDKSGYDGIDIDYENMLTEDRDLFTAFIETLAERVGKQEEEEEEESRWREPRWIKESLRERK